VVPEREAAPPAVREHELEHVVDGHHALQALLCIDDADDRQA